MKRRTPQEKKALSYAKDRRNRYGENDKASRTAIPFRKRLVNRANRHHDQRLLADAVGPVDPDLADAAEQRASGRARLRWRKQPDEPLGQYVARRLARRDRTPRDVP